MNVIQILGKALQDKKWMNDVDFVVDGMKLFSEAVWDPKARTFVGNIDYGTAIPELVDGEATEALVFMVVGMTRNCKHPTGYVLQYKCTTAVQAQLINFFIAYSLGPRPLPHPYVYAIGLGPRPSYIFPLTKTAYEMGK